MSKTNTQISFGFIDVTAKKDSNLQVNNKQDFTDLSNLKQDDIEEVQYATCEKNQFILDGNFELMQEKPSNMCWWSNEMSDKNGNFITPLTLIISFNEVHSSVGLTLTFSKTDNYCSHLKVEYYDIANKLISSNEFYPDSHRAVCRGTAENYKTIIITFYSTNNPYRYLKLYKILYGSEKIFEGENLQNANLLEETDLISSEISFNTLDFTAYSDDDEFNLINPKGLYRLLQERQKLQVTETIKEDNTTKVKDMGTFYLDKWQNEKNKIMKFKAIDLIGVIDKTTFYGGMYKDKTVDEVVKEIMTSAGLEKDDYEIEERLKNIKLNGYIPICSHRAALQQVAFVICAVVDCSRSSKIKIYSLQSKTEKIPISKDADIFQGTRKTEQSEVVTGVSLVLHTYEDYETPFDDGIYEMDELCSYTITELGIHVLTFDEPAWDIRMSLDVSTNSTSKITIDKTMIQSSTCNSATIDFNINKVGQWIAIAMAKEAYIKKYGSTEGIYFYPDGNDGYIYTVTPRRQSDTVAVDWYTVDIENKTVESDNDAFPKMTVEPKIKVNIYGYKYKHSETQFQANVQDIIKKGDNILKVDSCYLLNTDNMNAVAENILNYYNRTYKDEFKIILKDEQVTDKVELDTGFEQNLVGNVTHLDIDLTGGFLANCKIVGKMEG